MEPMAVVAGARLHGPISHPRRGLAVERHSGVSGAGPPFAAHDLGVAHRQPRSFGLERGGSQRTAQMK